jgi:hypothetical protein
MVGFSHNIVCFVGRSRRIQVYDFIIAGTHDIYTGIQTYYLQQTTA